MSVDDEETLAVYTAEADQYAAIDPSETERRALDGFWRFFGPGPTSSTSAAGPGCMPSICRRRGIA
jgi:hypothetical protein